MHRTHRNRRPDRVNEELLHWHTHHHCRRRGQAAMRVARYISQGAAEYYGCRQQQPHVHSSRCAVQELHRIIVLQQTEIRGLNEKINVLLNYIDLSKIMTLQDEISELRSRFDVLLNYIDLTK